MANGRVREYIGARYVPIFADPVTWDDERAYDPLTMVQYSGETYMSKQFVPIGAPLPTVSEGQESNEFWVHMSNWNAQVEAYREEVMRYAAEVLEFDGRITTNANNISTITGEIGSGFDSTNTVAAAITAINTAISAITADGWVTESRIASNAVTTSKINDSAITSSKIENSAVTSGKINNGAVTTAKIPDGAITTPKLANDGILVIFGDSWSDDAVADSVYGAILGTKLNCTVKNYAENGASYLNTGHTLLQQVAAFNADTSYDKSCIKYYVMTYGVNDQYTRPTTEGNSWNHLYQLITACRSANPNAPILHMINFTMCIATNRFENQWSFINGYFNHTTDANYKPVWLAPYFSVSDMNTSNYFHLKQSAQVKLAMYAAEWLQGGQVQEVPTWSIHIENRGNCYFDLSINVTNTGTEYNLIGYRVGTATTHSESTFNFTYPMPDCLAANVSELFDLGGSSYFQLTPYTANDILTKAGVAWNIGSLIDSNIYGKRIFKKYGNFQTF